MKCRGLHKLQLGISILFIILCFQDVLCKAQDCDKPKISFESDTLNYGTIARNSDPYRSIKFSNTGSAPLLLESVVGDVVSASKYPREPIQPGQSGEIKVVYPTDRIGPFINFIAVTSNGTPQPKLIFVKGIVLPAEAANPAK